MRSVLYAGAALALWSGAASAASIGNDVFDFYVDAVGSGVAVTAQSAAGACDAFDGNGCDGSLNDEFFVDWLDEDTFDIGFTAFDSPLYYELNALDFAGGETIVDVIFDASGPHETFLFDPDSNPTGIMGFVDPIVGFGPDLITINLTTVGAFGGDAPTFRFDVVTRGTTPPPPPPTPQVPLPASALLLLAGLAGLARYKRR